MKKSIQADLVKVRVIAEMVLATVVPSVLEEMPSSSQELELEPRRLDHDKQQERVAMLPEWPRIY
jgi:hypothetical protein